MSNSPSYDLPPRHSLPSKIVPEKVSADLPALADAGLHLTVAASDESSRRIGLPAILHSLRRRWLIAIPLGLVTATIASGIGWWLWEPSYVAAAYLRVASRQPSMVFNTSEAANQPTYEIYKRTQRELIRNRFVLSTALSAPELARLPIIQEQLDPVNWLQRNLKVEYPGDAELLEISLRGEHPKATAGIVNAVCDAYVKGVVEAERSNRIERLRNLEKVLNDLDEKLRHKRTERNRLAETLGTGDSQAPTVKQTVAMQTHGAVLRNHLDVQFDLMRATARYKSLQAQLQGLDKHPATTDSVDTQVMTHPDYVVAKASVDRLSANLRAYEEVTAHADVLAQRRAEIAAANKSLKDVEDKLRPAAELALRGQMKRKVEEELAQLQADVVSLQEQEARLSKEVEKFNQEVQQVSRSSVDLQFLYAEIEHIEGIRKELATEFDSLGVELASTSRVEVVSIAAVPQIPEGRSRLQQVAICGAIAFCLPLFSIIWWDLRSRKVNSPDDVEHMPGVPLIGTLPILPTRIHRSIAVNEATNHWNRVLLDAVDAVREIVNCDARVRPIKVVIVTSAIGGEGKTTLACQLAMSFGRMGKSTVIVDLDLRRPATHHVFQEAIGPGIAELLRGQAEFDDVVRPTQHRNLYRISAGGIDRDSAQALCTRREFLQATVAKLRENFDMVIIDSCPVLPAVDALIIGQFVDGAVLSVMRDVSGTQLVKECHLRLERMGISVLGAVVTSKERQAYHSQYRYVLTDED